MKKLSFETLGKGINILEDAINGLDDDVIPGTVVFKLHDTFGFPYDLTADIAREKGLKIDEEGFTTSMNQQNNLLKQEVVLFLHCLLHQVLMRLNSLVMSH